MMPPGEATPSQRRFRNRTDAGLQLARVVGSRPIPPEAIVLAVPRGGVVVGAEVARALGLPLDVVVARRLGAPDDPGLVIGAIAPETLWLNEPLIRSLHIRARQLAAIRAAEVRELHRCEAMYRGRRFEPKLQDRTVIVVDDGIATGATMRVVLRHLRRKRPEALIVAVPVIATDVAKRLRLEADDICSVAQSDRLGALEDWYEGFDPVSDDEVRRLLAISAQPTDCERVRTGDPQSPTGAMPAH